MKFAHMSDVHLGVWNNHPELRELPLRAFEKALEICVEEKVDFIVISGDFFDTSMPAIDVMKFAAEKLAWLADKGIPVYAIAGSHDYSPTGKTMLGVLESARLVTNTHMRMVEDPKTGAKIFGVEGLRGGLDKQHYDRISVDAQSHEGFKIFMFHSAIQEYSIPMMESIPLSALPKGFDYYANGHIHVREKHDEPFGKIVFPGPIFPCDFAELEKIKWGSFVIADVDEAGYSPRLPNHANGPLSGKDELVKIEYKMLKMCDVELIEIEADGRSAREVENGFISALDSRNIEGKIVLLKAKGTLREGKPSDIDWRRISSYASEHRALSLKKSVHLAAKEAELARPSAASIESIEAEVIEKNIGKGKLRAEKERERVLELMKALNVEKAEDEKSYIYEEKVKANARKVLGV